MNVKIERVIKEIDKTKEKISEFQAKLRELEKQKTELENMEIVDAVRGMDISLADLAALLKTAKTGGVTSGQLGLKLFSIPVFYHSPENLSILLPLPAPLVYRISRQFGLLRYGLATVFLSPSIFLHQTALF